MSLNNIIKKIKDLINDKNNQEIRLIKHNKSINDTTLYFVINSYPIKVTTDFNKYCLAESILKNINDFNMRIVFKNKQPEIILEELFKLFNCENKETKVIFSDPFHIFQKINEFTKTDINYSKLEKEFNKFLEQTKISNISNKIPKELLLSPRQISQLIINEMKKVNRSKEHNHYVLSEPSNPYTIILRIKFNPDTVIGKIFSQIKKDFGYDYVEMKLNIEPLTYPFFPPKLEYVKPKIKLPLLLGLMDLDILKLENWNPIITLDYLISNLGTQLETILPDYIISDASTNSNSLISFNELEYELVKLAFITKETNLEKVNININAPKILNDTTKSAKYWKSGTGYSTDGSQSWDIKTFIKEQELQINEVSKSLSNINKMINDSNINIINESILINYIINQLKGINILEFEKYQILYNEIFNILTNLIGKIQSSHVINAISISLKNLNEEINMLFNSSNESQHNERLLQIYCISDWYLSKYKEPIKEIIIASDVKEQYCQIMKPLQFGLYDVFSTHCFIKNKEIKPHQKALMRILSEISSFKTSLPLNWESTIWVRVPKDNINLFSFLISGPKDTPYENGLFEFHAYFPENYPDKEPSVLIHTTGNGQVRFNPNLYANGKVCLSLLGTWQGQDGEKWNAKTSTFLQVMVSIQSLILIEQPYFNEPGWEREINSPIGKHKSSLYNEERQPYTIKLAMYDMIKNPPNGFEDVVKNHFKMKKDEIINHTLIWEQNASKYKELIKSNRNELIELIEKL